VSTRPEVGLCGGKDCRRSDGYRTVRRELRDACAVIELPCLDVCDGPVVVVDVRSSDAVVLERVGGRGLALQVVAYLVDGVPLPGRLRSRRVKGSAGATARRRLRRALGSKVVMK
jgi:hypothetical protein